MMALYSALLTVALVARTIFYLKPMLAAGKDREELRQRLGRVPAALVQAVSGKRVVWVHAVSVGEVLAASRLVSELADTLGDGWIVVVSTTTRTGQKLARERFGAERVFFFPLDFAHAVRPYLDALRPAAVVLMESEVWPRMMYECRRRGTPVIVVNARVSDRSFRRSRWVRWIWSRVLRRATLWLAQSEEDARRLVEMGARAECVRAIGNLKYDVRAPRESRVAELIREIAAGRPIIVAGSTVHGEPRDEDSYVIHAWEGRPRKDFDALLVLAPRHPERFEHVHAIATEFRSLKATELLNGKTSVDAYSALTPPAENRRVEIVVLDTIGDLAAVYGLADVAFVGGSLIRRGGHNPLEPAQFGVPVVMGASFENFRDVVETMRAADAIRIVAEVAGFVAPMRGASGQDHGVGQAKELGRQLVDLLTNREAARAMGERGRRVFEEQQGATGRATAAIVEMVRDGASS